MIYETLLSTIQTLERLTGEKQHVCLQVSEETYFQLFREVLEFTPKNGFKYPPHELVLNNPQGSLRISVKKDAHAL